MVRPASHAVELKGWTCLDAGWLEQVACSPNTREHESLVVIESRPSEIHAALLLAGFQPGAPGKWSYEQETLRFTPPTGDRLDVWVRYETKTGEPVEEPIRTWIRDDGQEAELPREPWVFGGSLLVANPEWMGEGEHYVADMTGSIVGLVTFGDEVVGFSRVVADQAAVQPPQWQVRSDHVPPVGTPVTLILRRAE
ncbi:MAG: YdjY domain-containing protein [Planctomycetota bacterium]